VRKYILDPMNRKKREIYSRFIQELDGDIALDLGCGYGVLTNIIAKKFNIVLAIDLSELRIDFCKEYSLRNENENIIPLRASAYQTPLKSNSIDLVTASGLMNISKHDGMVPSGVSKDHAVSNNSCLLRFWRFLPASSWRPSPSRVLSAL
jgi:SAM-dependent methyltransferase